MNPFDTIWVILISTRYYSYKDEALKRFKFFFMYVSKTLVEFLISRTWMYESSLTID